MGLLCNLGLRGKARPLHYARTHTLLGLYLCYIIISCYTTYQVITVACDSYTDRWTAFVQMTSYSLNQSLFGIQSRHFIILYLLAGNSSFTTALLLLFYCFYKYLDVTYSYRKTISLNCFNLIIMIRNNWVSEDCFLK